MTHLVRRLGQLVLLLLAGLVVLLGLGFWAATRDPQVTRLSATLAGLPEGPPLRLVLLSDTHAGGWDMPPSRLQRVVEQVNALEPDLVLLAGDYTAHHWIGQPAASEMAESLHAFAGLRARLGVFAVPGNHDAEPARRLMLGMETPRLLINRWAEAGPLVVAGVDSASHAPRLDEALAGIAPERPVLLLLHEPEQLLWRPRQQAPPHLLALAGHTHGGQLYLPFLGSPTEWREGRFPCRRGACRFNGWDVIVTSGVGTSTLPIRIGVRPEVVLLTLYPSTGRKSGTDR
ncbi:metallophosphoesterase [Thermaurantiacus sp.]